MARSEEESSSDEDSCIDGTSSKASMAEEIKRRQARYKQMLGTIRLLKETVRDREDALHVAEEQLVKRASAIMALNETNKRQKLDLEHYKSMISTCGITGNKGETISRRDMFESKSRCFRR